MYLSGSEIFTCNKCFAEGGVDLERPLFKPIDTAENHVNNLIEMPSLNSASSAVETDVNTTETYATVPTSAPPMDRATVGNESQHASHDKITIRRLQK